MAYFPNGTSFAIWQEDQCSDCLNYRDNGTGSFGCAITDTHWLLADKMHDSKCRRTQTFSLLDNFIPDAGPDAFKCKMRLTRQMIDDGAAAEKQERDRVRYESAMLEMHNGQVAFGGGLDDGDEIARGLKMALRDVERFPVLLATVFDLPIERRSSEETS